MYSKIYKITIALIYILNISESMGLPKVCDNGLKCVSKCCPQNKLVINGTCVEDSTIKIGNFSNVTVYNGDYESTGKSLEDVFSIVEMGKLHREQVLLGNKFFQMYLLEDGKLHLKIVLEHSPTETHVYDYTNSCVDFAFQNEQKQPEIVFRVTNQENPGEKSVEIILRSTAYITSCIFLALVLVVYSVLPTLRTLFGKVVMSVAASFLGAFLMLLTLKLVMNSETPFDYTFCYGINFCLYFFLLAGFFWMNVLSFDIWKQFGRRRSYTKQKKEYRDWRKFVVYSIYAWGTPLVMSIFLILLETDTINVDSIPLFIKPNIILNGCFFGPTERMYYVYTPMLILLICNWIFFSLTSYSIWQTKRDARSAGVTDTPNNIKKQMVIFLRLSLLMGISWVLEVASAAAPDLPIWYVTDFYNLCFGIALFVIAVCNKKVYGLFRQVYCYRHHA